MKGPLGACLLALAAAPATAQIPAAAESAAARGDSALVESAIRAALQRDPDNPFHHFQLGRWYRRQSLPWLRARANERFREAGRLARAGGNRRLEADAQVELGWMASLRYEQHGHRYLLVGDALAISPQRAIEEWRYLEDFFARQAVPDSSSGEGDYSAAEDHARAALAAEPGHLGATALLAVILGDRGRWEELIHPARAALRAGPRAPEGHRILGLALHRAGRTAEAAEAFDAALARMDSVGRQPYENLGALLRRADAARYDSLAPAQRAELRQLYWALAQPLALDAVNPVLVEFYARTTYADLRWTAPEENVRGWETDRGLIYLRYGPPDLWAVFPGGSLSESQLTTVWAYRRSHARFFFQGMTSFARASLAEDFAWYAREIREAAPARFDNLSVVAGLDTVLAQIAQFRGPAGGTTLAVFGFVPVGRMLSGLDLRRAQLEFGAIIKDNRMRDVARRVRTETVNLGDSSQLETRTWRFELFPDEYLLRLEAREPASDRAARAIMGLQIQRFGPDSLRLSDLVVADRIQPRDSTPRRWTDYFIDPSAGRVPSGSPVSFLWEVYNLGGDGTGIGRYRVELSIAVRSVERRGLVARIVGGAADAIGLTAQGDTLVGLSFEREVPVRGHVAIPNHLDVELGDAPDGLYGVQLTVTDLRSGQAATRRRQFVVTPNPGEIPRRAQ